MAASVIFMVANNFLLTKDSVVPTFKKQLLVSEVSFANKKKRSLTFEISRYLFVSHET